MDKNHDFDRSSSEDIDQSIINIRNKQAEEHERRKRSKFRQPRIPLKPSQMPYYYGYATESSEMSSSDDEYEKTSLTKRRKKKGVFNIIRSSIKSIKNSLSPHRKKSAAFKHHNFVEVARKESSPEFSPLFAVLSFTEKNNQCLENVLLSNENSIKLAVHKRSKFRTHRIPLTREQVPYYYGYASTDTDVPSSENSFDLEAERSEEAINKTIFKKLDAELRKTSSYEDVKPKMRKSGENLYSRARSCGLVGKVDEKSSKFLRLKTPQMYKMGAQGDDGKLRRSKRNRIPPLQHWMGQRPIYKHEGGDTTLIGVMGVKIPRRKRSQYSYANMECATSSNSEA